MSNQEFIATLIQLPVMCRRVYFIMAGYRGHPCDASEIAAIINQWNAEEKQPPVTLDSVQGAINDLEIAGWLRRMGETRYPVVYLEISE